MSQDTRMPHGGSGHTHCGKVLMPVCRMPRDVAAGWAEHSSYCADGCCTRRARLASHWRQDSQSSQPKKLAPHKHTESSFSNSQLARHTPGLLSLFVAAARSCVALLRGHQGSSAKIQKNVLPTPAVKQSVSQSVSQSVIQP